MLLDIVILPPVSVRRRLGKLASHLNHQYPARYVVDNKKLIPHISLYHFYTLPKCLPLVEAVVKKILSNIRPFSIKGALLKKGRYSIGLEIQKSKFIKRLNSAVLLQYAPLRTRSMPSTFEYKMTRQVKQAIKNYGTVGTVINYEPHITLLADFKLSRVKEKGSVGTYPVNFRANEIAITEVNKWYQVTRILKRFRV
ncbi:MAG: hypothetical protein HY974_03805 [Candidatus Kerfeldbacteria bacterium]|nr:hypothetical protein [Candidatus Kerfeldbacteria bacterium]